MMNELSDKNICNIMFFFTLLMLLAGNAWATAACTTPTSTLNAGMDTDEFAILPYCESEPEPCCTTDSVSNMAADAFDKYRKDFLMDSFYNCPVKPNFQKMADDIRNAIVFKTTAIGAFLDASVFEDTMRDLQVSSAKTMQNYAPSDQMCRFGTLTRSLSASEARVDANRLVLSEAGLARNLGTQSNSGSAGRGLDNESRLKIFVEQFCDLSDNAAGMDKICQVATPVSDVNHNRDIDFTRTLDDKPTLNADFTDADHTQEESDALILGQYIYGHTQPSKRISYAELDENPGTAKLYREYRSVFARRAAAQNTYNTLAAMKAAGSGASDSYMRSVLKQLGLPDADTYKYIGAQNTEWPFVNSSYNAQMELLTKKLYQDPAFFTNLMDSKTNVRRTSAAMQGIGLMQGRDIYRSTERSEMLLALLVELEARKMAVNNQKPKSQ